MGINAKTIKTVALGGYTRRMRHSTAEVHVTVGLRSLPSNGKGRMCIVKSIAGVMTTKILISLNISEGNCTSLGLKLSDWLSG